MREFPWYTPAEVVGLWAQAWDYDKKVWGEPYLILSEYDEETDSWQGQKLYNPRRNKFWGQSLITKKRELLCFERFDWGIRFFKNTPNADWSLIYPQAT